MGDVSELLQTLYRGDRDGAAILTERRREYGPPLDLFEAAATGDAERVAACLDERPEDAQAWSVDGFTALHLAAFFAHPIAVELLLERGAPVNAASDNTQRVQPLHSAAASGDVTVVKLLLGAGADPNAVQRLGFTPLHAAAQNGSREMVEALLAAGASPARANDEGETPADLAARGGHDDIRDRLTG